MPGRPTYPAIEVMLTICPWRLSRMYGNTAFTIATAPKTLMSNWRLNSSNEDSSRVHLRDRTPHCSRERLWSDFPFNLRNRRADRNARGARAASRRAHAKHASRQRQRGGRRKSGTVGIGGSVLGLQQLDARDIEVRNRSDAVAIGGERRVEGRLRGLRKQS